MKQKILVFIGCLALMLLVTGAAGAQTPDTSRYEGEVEHYFIIPCLHDQLRDLNVEEHMLDKVLKVVLKENEKKQQKVVAKIIDEKKKAKKPLLQRLRDYKNYADFTGTSQELRCKF